MRIKIDEQNKAVIAYGGYRGKQIRAVAVCREPEFDVDFGAELVKKKYKIRERYAKMRWHDKEITRLSKLRRQIDAMIADHDKSANYLDSKIQEELTECDNFVKEHFSEK
jgi:adenosylmethionine-8-amino-7-oxononanoate aminotransferase